MLDLGYLGALICFFFNPAEVVLNYRDDNLFTEVDKFPLAQDIVNCKNYAGCNRLTMLEL